MRECPKMRTRHNIDRWACRLPDVVLRQLIMAEMEDRLCLWCPQTGGSIKTYVTMILKEI